VRAGGGKRHANSRRHDARSRFSVPSTWVASVAADNSINGIYSMKPSWSRVSREGVRMTSPTQDTIGWYGRSVEDLALVAEASRIGRDLVPVSVKGRRVEVCRCPVRREVQSNIIIGLFDSEKHCLLRGQREESRRWIAFNIV
jgi:hypothetical protein